MFDKIAAALSVVALAVAGAAFMKTQTPATVRLDGESVRAYLMQNPETIVEAMQAMQARQQAQELAAASQVLSQRQDEIFNDGYSQIVGNPDGDVTIVEFADYNCGFCKRAHGELAELLERDGNIRVVVKEFPILGPGSTFAAQAALASVKQDPSKYEAFNDALMKRRGRLDEAAVIATAEDLGFDIARLRSDMQGADIQQMIDKTYALAQDLQINGTPAFIIGNEVVRGFIEADRMGALAEAARRES